MYKNIYKTDAVNNAIYKKGLEIDLLYTKTIPLPIKVNDFPVLVCFSTLPGSLEGQEFIMRLIREMRLNGIRSEFEHYFKDNNVISAHEAFVNLYALNSLRKHKIPNFPYYYGVVEEKTQDEENYEYFYTISELNTKILSKTYESFSSILKRETFENILRYYVSILLAIYNANNEFKYTNYNLNLESIYFRKISDAPFDVEYKFENCYYWIRNNGYLPIISNNEKAYIKIQTDGKERSFGYNIIDDIPFESKGVYVDRDFVIGDAYKLLWNIIDYCRRFKDDKLSPVNNLSSTYENFLSLLEFFGKYYPKHIEEYHKNDTLPINTITDKIKLSDFITFIFRKYSWLISYDTKIDAIRSIGCNLEIKSRSINYYSVKNVMQLYDFLKFHSYYLTNDNTQIINEMIESGVVYYTKYFENESLNKEHIRKEFLASKLETRNTLYEIPKDLNLLGNSKYANILIQFIRSSIEYYNWWEQVKTQIKILKFISYSNESYESLYHDYEQIIVDNEGYYNFIYSTLIKIRNIFRQNLQYYNTFSNQILFLETLE